MAALLLILTLLYIGGVGYWIMKKIDNFTKGGNIHSAWDSESEKSKEEKGATQSALLPERILIKHGGYR